eukprot:Pgem_evm1s1040
MHISFIMFNALCVVLICSAASTQPQQLYTDNELQWPTNIVNAFPIDNIAQIADKLEHILEHAITKDKKIFLEKNKRK